MADVHIHDMFKRYGTTTAVDHISLDVRDGELMVFLGPSGCGKTTTLRSIAGLEHPESGDILIGPRRVNHLSPSDRDIAFVFQFYALYPHLSVFDNIAFPLRAQHVMASDVDQRVHSVARVLQIEPLLRRRIKQLSSGEQQRVALGRALIRRPQVLLMDEPLTNLDAKLRSEMRALLKHLQREQRITTVYVTHDQIEAMALGDRITVMSKGRIQQVGTPMDVYRHPANLFVAGFLGTPPMSLITCTLKQEDGRVQAVRGSFVVDLPPRAADAVQARDGLSNIVLGLRPEAIILSSQQPSPTENGTAALGPSCQVTVYAVEPLGDENIVDVRLSASADEDRAVLRARTAPAVRPHVGDTVWIAPVTADVHVFDPRTEDVIGEATDIQPSAMAAPSQPAVRR